MSSQKKKKPKRPKPRLYKGFRDLFSGDLQARHRMIETIRGVYEGYGFVPLETPAVEYVEMLGKFLPESQTPEGGIFSWRDEDDEWVALRYDLTAPLARVVAQYQGLQRPYRRYQVGPVWRMEKPGPGRFREFYQFDFDTVGSSSMAADAEACCVACDVLEALGIGPEEYQVQVNNRKVLGGLLEAVGIGTLDTEDDSSRAMNALRAVDKLDRVGVDGVERLLGPGRKDPSGDFTPGVGLEPDEIDRILSYVKVPQGSRGEVCAALQELVGGSELGAQGVAELEEIDRLLTALGYGEDRVSFVPTIVRGMGYYTGPVYEAVLTREIVDEKGETRQIGSIFGGGRYDGLVKRFTGQEVPATGASIGVDRLLAALKLLGRVEPRPATAQVLVTRLDKSLQEEYLRLAQQLRSAGIRAEAYLGSGGLPRQLKYADKVGIPVALIMGGDEQAAGQVTLKDLEAGSRVAEEIADREEWLQAEGFQQTVPMSALEKTVRAMLTRTDRD